MTLDETNDLIDLLSTYYQEREITPRMIAAYALAWADTDPERMREAALAYVRSGEKFFPAPGQVMHALDDVDTATEEAWGEVFGAIERVGYCGTPKWSSPLIERAVHVTLGNWSTWCASVTTDQIPSHRARFIDAMRALAKNQRIAREAEATRRIAGAAAGGGPLAIGDIVPRFFGGSR